MLHLRRWVEITIKARINRGGSRWCPLMASARHRNRLNSPPSKALIYMLEHTGLNLPSIHPSSLIYKSIFGLQTWSLCKRTFESSQKLSTSFLDPAKIDKYTQSNPIPQTQAAGPDMTWHEMTRQVTENAKCGLNIRHVMVYVMVCICICAWYQNAKHQSAHHHHQPGWFGEPD